MLRRIFVGCSSKSSLFSVRGISSETGNVGEQNVANGNTESVLPPPESQDSNILMKRDLPFLSSYSEPRKSWVLNMDTVDETPVAIMDLHPEVFGAKPRIDIIKANVAWQMKYKKVSFAHAKVTAEVQRTGRKPWPQKGTGRARHGTRRSPLFLGGATCHGPRSPTSHFFMLPLLERVQGLCSTLTVKLIQDDLYVVNNLDIPTTSHEYILDMLKSRNWGPSVLFVDTDDVMPKNITLATDPIKYVNLMPVYGLNVHSMLKYTTLVLTVAAVERIEEKLLLQMHGPMAARKHVTKYKQPHPWCEQPINF